MTDQAPIERLSDVVRSRMALRAGEDREDAVQAAVAEVLRRYPSLPEAEQARLALFGVRWQLLARARQARTEQKHLPRLAELRSSRTHADPAEAAELAERRELLQQAIGELLDGDQRAIISGHFARGTSLTELAQQLGVSKATVSRRLAEAIAALRRGLSLWR